MAAASAALRGLDAPALAAVRRARGVAPPRRGRARSAARPGAQRQGRCIELARRRPHDAGGGARARRALSPTREAARRRRSSRAIAGAPPGRRAGAGARGGRRARARSAGRRCCSRSCSSSPRRAGVAARLLATRADAEELARVVDERGLEAARELPALATWRRDVLGELWVGWLTGTLALVGDPPTATGLRMVPRGDVSSTSPRRWRRARRTIVVPRGRHVLAKPLRIASKVTIRGTGTIVGSAGAALIVVAAGGELSSRASVSSARRTRAR